MSSNQLSFKTDFDIARAAALKVVRNQIRLRHAIAADDEIARTLPALDAAIFEKKTRGEGFELTTAEIQAVVESLVE